MFFPQLQMLLVLAAWLVCVKEQVQVLIQVEKRNSLEGEAYQ